MFASSCELRRVFRDVKDLVSVVSVLLQTADGVPVHLKRGYPDRLLYRTTMALTVGGALYCLVALYFAAQPNRK